MSHSITIKFFDGGWLPHFGDRYEYHFMFDFVDTGLVRTPEEKSQFQSGNIMIGVTGTLASCWGFHREDFQEEDLKKVLYELTKRHVKNKIEKGSVEQFEELQLNTANTETQCPYDPNSITLDFDEPIIVITEEVTPHIYSGPEVYAERIISLRDNINALCKEKLGNRLLNLPQERAIIELIKTCSSHEEFSHRVSSLAGLASSLNIDLIRTILKNTDQSLKSIALLERFFKKHCGLQDSDKIIEPLKNLNRLRQGYPVHTNHAGGVVEAHTFFGLNYPIEDWEGSWQILIEHYMKFLERLLSIIIAL